MIWSLVAFLGLVAAQGVLHGVLRHHLEVRRVYPQGAQVLGNAQVPAKGLQTIHTGLAASKGDMPSTFRSMALAITANRSRLPIRLNSCT